MIHAALPFAVLALAAYRTWRLLALDTLPVLVRSRDRILGYDGFAPSRPLLAEWLTCPWCSGFWVALAWYLTWLAWPDGSLYPAVPLALSALVGALASAFSE